MSGDSPVRFLRDQVFPFYAESPILANWLGIVHSRIDWLYVAARRSVDRM